MKVLTFFFVFVLVNSIYSQIPQCNNNYTITMTNPSNCNFTFTANFPGSPTVTAIDWTIANYSSYATSACFTGTGNPFSQRICFDGNYTIDALLTFTGGGQCHIRNVNVYLACSGTPTCDPDPATFTGLADPVVEITYKAPVNCGGRNSTVANCMYEASAGNCPGFTYCIACDWEWAIRIPASGFNCDIWSYYVQYTTSTSCGSTTCLSPLVDTNLLCIDATMGQTIYIVATANNCCVPNGYQRSYYWTPSYASQTPIGDPITTLGQCAAYRACPNGNSGNCQEIQYTMSYTSGWPNPKCLIGGKKLEQRAKSIMDENADIEQNVLIYNVEGVEVFNGKWKFGDPKNLNLNWPKNIGSGIYFVKFPNSSRKESTKLYKIN